MGKFEEINKNANSIITKDIDKYLRGNEFKPTEIGSLANREKGLERVYSDNGHVTYVTILKDRVYVYREDNTCVVLIEKDYFYKENTIDNLQNFIAFMDKIYEEIFD